MKILLANPRGFCAGVERAIQIVELALEHYGPPVYVRHEIVHNRSVVESLRQKGVVFVDSPAAAPRGSVLIFSAHGVSPAVRAEAAESEHRVIDATCPLVTKVHMEAKRFAAAGDEILLIGHKGHIEVEGTMGEAPAHTRLVEDVLDAQEIAPSDPNRIAVLTQTTLSVDDTADVVEELRRRFPRIATPKRSDICYATQNRQNAAKKLAAVCDLIIVVGSANSSNGMRLVETARRGDTVVERVDVASELDPKWLANVECVGVMSGAAVPEESVHEVVERLAELGGGSVEIDSMPAIDERMRFQLPSALREQVAQPRLG
jgi:4-hydroxy-3-methylbut-2-enyl diphosphate reductase